MMHPDWQHGMAVVHVAPNGFFNVQLIPVLYQETLFYGGKRYGNGGRARRRGRQ